MEKMGKIMEKAVFYCVTLPIMCVGLFVGWLGCVYGLDDPDIEYYD